MSPITIAITDPQTPGWLDTACTLAASGAVTWIHLRAKHLPHDHRAAAAHQLAAACAHAPTRLMINGDVDIAHAVRAGALHLPRDVPRPPWDGVLSRACHDLPTAHNAQREGCTLITLSPIFSPRSKPDARPVIGLEGLAAVCRAVDVGVVALGGMDPARGAACVRAGAGGWAAIGHFFPRPQEPDGGLS